MSKTERTKTILLVDDDIDFLTQYESQLKAVGFGVSCAENSEQALELLEAQTIDLAVVDLMMEHMDDGFVLCHRIKQMVNPIPVILVTAVTRETGMEFDASSDQERSWLKADAVLAKPIRFEQLKSQINRLLS